MQWQKWIAEKARGSWSAFFSVLEIEKEEEQKKKTELIAVRW